MIIDLNRLSNKYLVVDPENISYKDFPRYIGPIKNVISLEDNEIKIIIGDEDFSLGYKFKTNGDDVDGITYISKSLYQAMLFSYEKYNRIF